MHHLDLSKVNDCFRNWRWSTMTKEVVWVASTVSNSCFCATHGWRPNNTIVSPVTVCYITFTLNKIYRHLYLISLVSKISYRLVKTSVFVSISSRSKIKNEISSRSRLVQKIDLAAALEKLKHLKTKNSTRTEELLALRCLLCCVYFCSCHRGHYFWLFTFV